ncbi:MAG: leucine-rich repeat protein [Bacteroidales bacterium]
MKKTLFILVAIVFALNLSSKAEDFSAVNSEGDTIYYNIISPYYAYSQVEVTFKDSNEYAYNDEYIGAIAIPDSVLYDGNYYYVSKIGDRAFYYCTGLTSVTIPNSVTQIGDLIFYNCYGLVSVTIPNHIYMIPFNTFYNCTSLQSITLPENLIYLNSEAFYGCRSLTSITIPHKVRNIGPSAFEYCTNLTSVILPDSLTAIYSNAFKDCVNLDSITIPNTVTLIGGNAFLNTPFYNNMPDGLVYINNILYSYKGSMSPNTSIGVRNGTISISGNAFKDYSGLVSIYIPNSVASIGGATFMGCSNLKSIKIPDSLKTINSYTFSGCSSLTSVKIPDNVISIGSRAFNNCTGLQTIVLPSILNFISINAFDSCIALSSIINQATTPQMIFSNTFKNVNKAIPVYIPVNTLSSYQTAQYWSEFTNFIERNYQYIDTTVCDGNTYNFNGTILDSAGIYFNDSVVLTINITPAPNVPQNLSVYNITMNYVTVSWQGNADSYDIYRNDSLIVNVTDTIFVDNFSMQQGTTYHYNIKAINNTGCESALSDTVWFAIIGLGNIENSNIQAKLYPNPTNDKSTLEIEGLTSYADVLVYDMIGRLIQTHKINQGTKALDIDLRGYAKGVYNIKIVNESINQTKKLIVQ